MFDQDRRRKILTLGAMCFGLFMVMLDNTVVNLALPTIQRTLSAGFTELQWIVDAFVLLVASLMLTGGRLGDLYGRKRVFMSGLALFTLGSLECALAPSVTALILGRVVQGTGAAILLPSTLAILTNTFLDPKERAQAIGLWAGVSATALALGPVLGGVMVDALGWQSVFWINIPIGILAFVVTWRAVVESRNPEASSLDIPGQILAIVGLGSLTFALIEANRYGWSSPVILGMFGVAVVGLGAFILVELRTRTPMLNFGFFKNLTYLGSNAVGLCVSFGFFGIILYLGLFLQNVQGYSAGEAGILQLPLSLVVMVTAVISGRIVGRFGARHPVTIGMLILGVFMMMLTRLHPASPYSSFWWMLSMIGVGQGLVMSPITTAAMSTVPPARAGMASATLNTVRQLGGVLGIALLGSVITGRFTLGLHQALAPYNLPASVVDRIVQVAEQGEGAGVQPVPGIDVRALTSLARDAFTNALHVGLWISGAFMFVGAIAGYVMIRHQGSAAEPAVSAAPGGAGPECEPEMPACTADPPAGGPSRPAG